MDEFSLINTYFKTIEHQRTDVILGIGDDAACLQVLPKHNLLVSTDTLVAGVHFLANDDPYAIAFKAISVNVSDIVAMSGVACWVSLALTLPSVDNVWLARFSTGLSQSLNKFNLTLVGGDTTRGPLTITVTIHGQVPIGKAVKRSGALAGDLIYVSGPLGAAALAVKHLINSKLSPEDHASVMQCLYFPNPRIDLVPLIQEFATSAIDISDGLGADLNHLCVASNLGATLKLTAIPIHPVVKRYAGAGAFPLAFSGGEDYELCFTLNPKDEAEFLRKVSSTCYKIGVMEAKYGLRGVNASGDLVPLSAKGYTHF